MADGPSAYATARYCVPFPVEAKQDPIVTPDPIPLADAAGPRLFSLGGLVSDLEADSRRRFEAKRDGRPLGPVPCLPKLATAYGGAFPEGVHIMLGGSGVGKTALALQLAAACECPALYVSCEMTALELMRRLCARNSKTFLGKYKDGTLSPSVVATHARQLAEDAPLLAIADATTAYASPTWIEEKARAIRGESAHVLVIIDSLHSWASSAGLEASEYELVSAAAKELRALAARLECPVLAISEMNRASMSRGSKDDKLSAGAGSRKIEYGSESVISLEADSDEMDEPDGSKPITLTFAKNRHGAKGAGIKLLFHGALQSYREG